MSNIRLKATEYMYILLKRGKVPTYERVTEMFKKQNIIVDQKSYDQMKKLFRIYKRLPGFTDKNLIFFKERIRDQQPINNDLFENREDSELEETLYYTYFDLVNLLVDVNTPKFNRLEIIKAKVGLLSFIHKYDYYLEGKSIVYIQTVDTIYSLLILPNKDIVSGSLHGLIEIWNPQGNKKFSFHAHTNIVCSLTMLPDGRFISLSNDCTVKIWNPFTGNCDLTVRNNNGIPGIGILLTGNVVTAFMDSTLRIWNPLTGKIKFTLKGHTDEIFCLIVIPDGRIVSGGKDRTIRIWDLKTGKKPLVLKGHTNTVKCITFINGDIISGSEDTTVRIWDSTTGEQKFILEGHTKVVKSIKVLRNGNIVSSSNDSTLRIWNPKLGTLVFLLLGHKYEIISTILLSDGNIASSAVDFTLRIWNYETGEQKLVIKNFKDSIQCMAVMDKYLVTGAYDNNIQIFE